MDLMLEGKGTSHAVRLSRLVIPEMKKAGGGSTLNIASIAGRESGSGITYNSAKAALISFSKALAQQTAKDSIRVNSLAPGSVFSPEESGSAAWRNLRTSSRASSSRQCLWAGSDDRRKSQLWRYL